MIKTAHYWRIHARVTKRLFTDLALNIREILTSDVEHNSETFKWFENKVNNDTMRLYEDPSYYDNSVQAVMLPSRKIATLWGNRFY